MGFVALLLLAFVGAALLWRMGVARPLWSLVGAALMLGAAGYTLQGRPMLPGAPREADAVAGEVDPGLVALRGDLFGKYGADTAYLVAADGMTLAGDAHVAAAVTLGGIAHYPDSAALWSNLGTTLAKHDGGQVSPAALFAFRRAMRLAPGQAGPPFFAGLAYLRAERFAEALALWRRALALTPEAAPYRPAIAVRVALLEALLRRMPTR